MPFRATLVVMHGLFARTEVRSQWRGLLVVAVFVCVSVTAVVGPRTSASRSVSAFHRLRDATAATDVEVAVDAIADLPQAARAASRIEGVADAAGEVELFVRPAGTELF